MTKSIPGRLIGYARVATSDRLIEPQLARLRLEGCETLFSEVAGGMKHARPELQKALGMLKAGDVLVVEDFERLSRSMTDRVTIVSKITSAGAAVRSLND